MTRGKTIHISSVQFSMNHHHIILLLFIKSLVGLDEKMYKMTKNMTINSWNSFIKRTLTTQSVVKCASQCLYEKETCNAWHFESGSKMCQLGKVIT